MNKFLVISAVLVAVSFKDALAISEDERIEIKSAVLPFLVDCAKDHGTSLTKLKTLREAGKLSEIDPCLMACVARKAGVLTDAGLYDPEAAVAKTKKFLSDPADISKTSDIAKSCASVNMQAVTDGSKGCERAKLLGSCLYKHKDEANQMHKGIIQARLLSSGVQCIQDNPLSLKDIQTFRKKMIPDGDSAKCFAACMFKKIGIGHWRPILDTEGEHSVFDSGHNYVIKMDDMGNISTMSAKEKAEQVFKNDDMNILKVTEIIEACTSVNEMPVADGNKGCDRAKLAFSCLVENASKLGFDVNF